MTLGRLMELYQAEKQGKQIMERTGIFCKSIKEVKITECDLKILADIEADIEKNNYRHFFFIKDEEDEDGNKINKK